MGRLMSYASLTYAGDTTDPARAKFYGDAQEQSDRYRRRPAVLRTGAQPARRLRARRGDGERRARPLPALARGHPQGEAAPARRRDRAAVPRKVRHRRRRLEPAVRRDDRLAAVRDRRRGADAGADAGAHVRTPTRRKREAAAKALAETLRRQPARVHADHRTRSPRTRRSPTAGASSRTSPIRAISPIASSAKSSTRWSQAVTESYPAALASLLRAEGALVRQGQARPLGPQRAAAERAATRTFSWDAGARHGARRLRRLLAAHGRHRAALLRRRLDRRAGAARQGARRLRASDDALGASLCAGQLSRQAARRDDARARTRPRRASGARRAERRADGADAADAGRDRQRVRRDADLPRAAGLSQPTRPSASRCWPPRSRTCSTPSCGRSRSTNSSA